MIIPFRGTLPDKPVGTEGSAGFDLCIAENAHIYPQDSVVVSLGCAVEIPEGYYGLLTHRSSLAFKHECILSTGIIDSDFRGTIKAKVFNLGKDIVHLEKGTKIAQMIICKYNKVELVNTDKLSDTARGEGGFGSTGV